MARKTPLRWAPIAGKWSFQNGTANYLGPEDQRDPFGLALSADRLRQGTLEVAVRLKHPTEGSARLVFGYDSSNGNYFSIGIGGYGRAMSWMSSSEEEGGEAWPCRDRLAIFKRPKT